MQCSHDKHTAPGHLECGQLLSAHDFCRLQLLLRGQLGEQWMILLLLVLAWEVAWDSRLPCRSSVMFLAVISMH